MSPVIAEAPDRAVVDEALSWPERAASLAVIATADAYETACELLLGIKDLRKKIAETFDPHVRRAHESHKALVKEKADAEAPLTQAEGVLKAAIRDYDVAQERIRREQQRLADEVARRAAEDEALAQAAALETAGHQSGDESLVAEAHAIIEAPIAPLPMAPIQKATPKVAGVTLKKQWAFRVVNPDVVPRKYLVVNESAIRGVVKALGPAANIPGVQVYEETSVAAGRR